MGASENTRRRVELALATAVCLLAMTACGSSARNASGSSSSPKKAAGIQFSDCMRSHGVPNFPDPGAGGGIQIGSGINPASPAFQSAQRDCANVLPFGGKLGGAASESFKIRLLHLAQCMRSHGLKTFPDPTANRPSPGSGFGIAFGHPGAFIAVSQALVQSPAFRQAAVDCDFPGARGNGAKTAAPG